VGTKQPKKVETRRGEPICTDPLAADHLLLSVSAQLNLTGRWISSQFAELEQYGGFEAASDCFAAADILLEFVKQWSDELREMDVAMPQGIGYVSAKGQPGT
jgi:hypothetical protein